MESAFEPGFTYPAQLIINLIVDCSGQLEVGAWVVGSEDYAVEPVRRPSDRCVRSATIHLYEVAPRESWPCVRRCAEAGRMCV
jgi:hypothetical protein